MSHAGIVKQAIRDLFEREPRLSPVAWTRDNYYLPPELAPSEGPFRPWAGQRGMMEIWAARNGPDECDVQKGSQIGYTIALLAFTAYAWEHLRRRIIMYLPTDDDARDFAKAGIVPMVRDCPKLQPAADGSEDGRHTRKANMKILNGRPLRVLGAQVAGRFRRVTSDFTALDELDDYAIINEGDAISLASRSCQNSPHRLVISGSSPTFVSTSQIVRAVGSCSLVLDWLVPCPECGHKAPMRWKQMVFDEEGDYESRAASVMYLCTQEGCGALWSYRQLTRQTELGCFGVENGVEVHDGHLDDGRPWPAKVGLRINGMSSPYYPWAKGVLRFLNAQGDVNALKTWTNHYLGEPFEDQEIRLEQGDLRENRQDLSTLPDGVLTVVASVDVQSSAGGWLSVMVVGFGLGEEAWIIHRDELYGDISDPEGHGWEQLREWLRTKPTWYAENGDTRQLSAVVLESGHQATTCYEVADGTLPVRAAILTKGRGGWSLPMLVRPSGKAVTNRGSVLPLWTIGTDQSKQHIATRLNTGGIHLDNDLPEAVDHELSAESLVISRSSGQIVRKWKIKSHHTRNEALDTLIGAFAGLRVINPPWLRSSESREAARKFAGEDREVREKEREVAREKRTVEVRKKTSQKLASMTLEERLAADRKAMTRAKRRWI